MSDLNGADSIIEAAREATRASVLDHGQDYLVRDSSTMRVLSLEYLREAPDRKAETLDLITADSLVQYVRRHYSEAGQLYAEPQSCTVVAVLNDSTAEAPGWLDHRAVLRLQRTTAWRHWASRDGKIGSQVEFAEHIENGLLEISSPPAADMLELAQNFQAHSSVTFQSGKRLADGSRQLTYHEDIQARAGQTGTIDIPREFELVLEPFEGSELVKVTARLRFRISDGNLAIGYQLVRPEDVLRQAFLSVVEGIEGHTSITALWGSPPARKPFQEEQ